MHPDIRHAVGVEGAAGLREFVLVMRKHQIDAAAMDVELLAEMLPRHRRAFDVPARTAAAAMPDGDGHDGSPGFDGFHSTKSVTSRL